MFYTDALCVIHGRSSSVLQLKPAVMRLSLRAHTTRKDEISFGGRLNLTQVETYIRLCDLCFDYT